MDDGAEGVDVAFGRVTRQFGRLPKGRPGRVVGGEIERRVAKVCEDDVRVDEVGVGAEEDVGGFDVPVADAFAFTSGVEAAVEEVEGREELLEDVPDEGFGQEGAVSFVLVDELVQVASRTVFEVVASPFESVRFEGVEVDDVVVPVREDVLEHGGLDGFGVG